MDWREGLFWRSGWAAHEIRHQVAKRLPRGNSLIPLLASPPSFVLQSLKIISRIGAVWLTRKSLIPHENRTPEVLYGFFTISLIYHHQWMDSCTHMDSQVFDLSLLVAFVDKQEMDEQRERSAKEASEINGLKRVSDDIIPHILNLWVTLLYSSPLLIQHNETVLSVKYNFSARLMNRMITQQPCTKPFSFCGFHIYQNAPIGHYLAFLLELLSTISDMGLVLHLVILKSMLQMQHLRTR